MVYKKAYRRKRPAMKKRGKKRSTAMPKIPGVYNYKRYCSDSTLTNFGPGTGGLSWEGSQANWQVGAAFADDNGLYQFGGSLSFQLNDIIAPGDFISLYDSYKITAVKLTICPLANQGYVGQSSNTNASSATIPTIYYVTDDDDTVIPVSQLTILEKQKCKFRRLDKPFTITIRNPKVLQALQINGSTIVPNANPRTPWIDCNSANADFYGLKFFIRDMPLPDPSPAPAVGINSLIRIQARYYLSFKDPQ